jgi:hypothetical protein
MSSQVKEQPKWVRFVLIGFAAIWLGVFLYRYINPTARAGRAVLGNLSSQEILSLSIEPARSGYPTLVTEPIVVRDRQAISVFANALSQMPTHNPEHPNVTQAVILRIQLKDRVIGGYLEGSSNDGTTFYYMSGVNTGWVFGTYWVLKGSDLFKLIRQIAPAPSVPNNSFKADASGAA